ncbi:MAG: hypothetical protein ACR2M6_01895 [Vampirovibrionia bacterium]
MKLQKIGEQIKEITGVDIFDQSRRRELVEMRSVANVFMHDVMGMGWTEIVREYKRNGFKITHASLIHSYDTYKDHSFYNRQLPLIHEVLLNDSKINIIKKVSSLSPEKLEEIEEILK